MALYVLFENENTFLFLYIIWLLLNLQMFQIILPDPVLRFKSIDLQKKVLALLGEKYNQPLLQTLFMRTNSFDYKLCLTCKNFNLYETGCFAKNNAHPWPNLLQ